MWFSWRWRRSRSGLSGKRLISSDRFWSTVRAIHYAVIVFVMIAATATYLFLNVAPRTASLTHFEGDYDAMCTNTTLRLWLRSLTRGKISLENATVVENSANCTPSVPHLILNTEATITCKGTFEEGTSYTVSFDGRAVKKRC